MLSNVFTFLFTDIEGSTRRWDAYPDQMRLALATHDRVLRRASEAHKGHVFKTVGDAFCVAFESSIDAVLAAMAIQREIAQGDWSSVEGLRVRMGLHMGAAELRDDDYFGPALNRVARIQSLAAGGQTLISSAVFEVIKEPLRANLRFEPLGTHRLKDLTQPEQLFQLSPLDEPAPHFPPLKSLDSRPHNLPLQPTSFIGREKEIRELQALLQQSTIRLVTLTGPGGIGKSRLSLQVAAELIEQFADGVFFVALAEIEEPALVPTAIAQVLGVSENHTLPIEELLMRHLQAKQMLLILDNFEQVVEAAAFIAQLVRRAPQVKLVISSQIVLQLYGEQEFPLRQLKRPPISISPNIEELLGYESVQLFVERAQAARPSFQLDEQNAAAVAQICRRLDGLPLALELAAARIKMFTPQAMLPRLAASLDLLGGGARNLPARQRTLRGAVEWSYSLLSESEQQLFEGLGVFSGGFTLEAVEAIVELLLPIKGDLFDDLTSLVNKSFIQQDVAHDETRFSLLVTLRDYAQEKLALHPWAPDLAEQHALYFVEQASAVVPGTAWLEQIERDYDNLRAAFQWAIQNRQRHVALRLCCTLPAFWETGGRLTEGRQWLQESLSLPEPDVVGYQSAVAHQDQFQAWIIAGNLAEWQGDYPIARSYYQTSLDMADAQQRAEEKATALQNIASVEYRCGNYDRSVTLYREVLVMWQKLQRDQSIALVLHQLGNIHYRRGHLSEAKEHYEESLKLRRRVRDVRGMAASLNNLGTLAQRLGQLDDAFRLMSESLELKRSSQERASVAILLNNLATLARRRGDSDGALKLFQESLSLKRALGDKAGMAYSLNGLGAVYLERGDLDEARTLFLKSLALTFEIGDKWGFSTCLTDLARLSALRGEADIALTLIGCVQAIQSQIGTHLTEVEEAERRAWLDPLCHSVGDRCPELLQRGSGLSIEQALALVQMSTAFA